jgi:hypothetical protein
MKQKKHSTENHEDFEPEETENLEDMKELLKTKCKRCRRTISLATCDFDEDENPICRRYSGGCSG